MLEQLVSAPQRQGVDLLLPPSRRLQQLAAGGRAVHGTDLRTTKFYRTQLCPFMKGGRPGRCAQGLDCGYAHCEVGLSSPDPRASFATLAETTTINKQKT